MGSEFFWFFDLLTLAVFAVYIFRGAKRGAVGVIISAAAAVIAVIVAVSFSGVISEGIYDKLIRDKVEAPITNSITSAVRTDAGDELKKIDMSKAKIKEKYLDEMTLEFDASDRAKLDLSSVDLSETGAEEADLSAFGLSGKLDLTDVKSGVVTVTKDDYQKFGLGNIVLARIIASNLTSEKISGSISDIGDKLSETAASGLKSFGRDLAIGSTDAIYSVAVTLISANSADYAAQIMDNIVTPMVLPPLRIIIFLILFALTLLILGLIANATKLINRIPGIGQVNGVLGAVLGAVEAIIVLIIVCLVIKLLITVCGNSLVFINEPTINKTFIFRFLYAFDPLAWLGL